MTPLKGKRGTYDAADLALLQTVYEDVCRTIGIDPGNLQDDQEDQAHALMLAVIDAAQQGERDPHILKVRALAVFSKPREADERN